MTSRPRLTRRSHQSPVSRALLQKILAEGLCVLLAVLLIGFVQITDREAHNNLGLLLYPVIGTLFAFSALGAAALTGGMLNPGVTLSQAIAGKLPAGEALGIIVGQLFGAAIGYCILGIAFEEEIWRPMRFALPMIKLPELRLFAFEFVACVAYLSVLLALKKQLAGSQYGGIVTALASGIGLAALQLGGQVYATPMLNPAFVFGQAFASFNWDQTVFYLAAQFLAAIAVGAASHLFDPRPAPQPESEPNPFSLSSQP